MKRHLNLLAGILILIIGGFYTLMVNTDIKYVNAEEHEQNLIQEEKTVMDKIVLKIAHSYPESHPQHIALVEKFLPMVEKGSNWKIRVEIYPNGQLGGDREYIQGLRNGIVEMCIGGIQPLSEIWPKLNVLELPYIFDNYDQASKVLNGPAGSEITEGMEKLGIHSLAWTLNGFHQISTNGKLLTPDKNQENLKIGTIFSKVNEDILEAMGFSVLPIRSEGMIQGSRQNPVDGYDNLPLVSYYNLWDQKHKYLFITNHMLSTSMLMVNSKLWDTLNEQYKTLIQEAAKVSANYEIELLKKDEKDIFESLERKDASIQYPELSEYKKRVAPVYQKWVRNDPDLKRILDKILSQKNK